VHQLLSLAKPTHLAALPYLSDGAVVIAVDQAFGDVSFRRLLTGLILGLALLQLPARKPDKPMP